MRRHGVHPTVVQLVREGLEVLRRAEAGVELGRVRNPIAMVRVTVRGAGTLVVLRDRADPDCDAQRDTFGESNQSDGRYRRTGSKTRVLDVVQVILDSLPGTATERLLGGVARVHVRTLGEREAVRYDSTGTFTTRNTRAGDGTYW